MSLLSICEQIQQTGLSLAIREGALPYPIIGGVHLLSIALFGGMLLAVDLRLLGWGLKRWSITDLVRQTRPWKWFGFVVITVTGLLLTWAEPVKVYHSPSFWIKMAMFALVGVHALIFRGSVYNNTVKLDEAAVLPASAKVAAALSLLLWAGLVFTGRWIAFDE